MAQQGQVVRDEVEDGRRRAALGDTGIGSAVAARGGYSGAASPSERDAGEALERALERLRRQNGSASTLTLAGARRGVSRAARRATGDDREARAGCSRKRSRAFGDRRLGELRSQEIAAWRMTISPGHRFEATQALRQVLARAVAWGMIDVNPAKQGVDNPQRRRTEKRPFESWAQLDAARRAGSDARYAAAGPVRGRDRVYGPGSGSRSSSATSTARHASSTSVARLRNGRLKCTKTEGSVRAVPLQAVALEALDQLPARAETELLFPSLRGGYFDLHNFRTREWKPAQTRGRDRTAPTRLRSAAHLRHLRAPCRHLDLRSLPLHGRQPDHDRPPLRPPRPRRTRPRDQAPRQLQPARRRRRPPGGRRVDTAAARRRHPSQRKSALAGENQKPSDGLEPSTPSLPHLHVGEDRAPVPRDPRNRRSRCLLARERREASLHGIAGRPGRRGPHRDDGRPPPAR